MLEVVGVTAKIRLDTSVLNVMKAGKPDYAFSTSEIVEVISQAEAPVHDLIAGTAVFDAVFTVAMASCCVGVFMRPVDKVAFVGRSHVSKAQLQVA